MKIIADINIIPSVVINISYGQPETISEATLINSCLCRHFGKLSFCIQIISIKPVTGQAIIISSIVCVNDIRMRMIRLVQYITIEIPIMVVIKESRLRGKAGCI